MKNKIFYKFKLLLLTLFLILIIFGFYILSLIQYNIFHTIIELISVLIGITIFEIAWNTRQNVTKPIFLYLGICFLFISILDFIHTLAYKGIQIFPGYDSNLPTQLWILSRYILSFSFIFCFSFFKNNSNEYKVLAGYSIITTLFLLFIFLNYFPTCFIEGQGLTIFKIGSEYIICIIFLIALWFYWKNRKIFDSKIYKSLIFSIIFMMIGEIFFTLYVSVFGISNFIGHISKFIAYIYIFQGLIRKNLQEPFSILFRDLKIKQDSLNSSNEQLVIKTAQLLNLTNEMSRSSIELEEYIYIVSHDLRESIRSIKSISQIISLHEIKFESNDTKSLLNRIGENAEKMNDIWNNLLMYAHIQMKYFTISDIDLNQVFNIAIENLSSFIQSFNAKIFCDTLPMIKGDSVHMICVFQNLINNAIKFHRPNVDPIIKIHLNLRNDNEWLISINDNGIGIESHDIEKLFIIFNRIHSHDACSGAGIGLATCRRIISLHGGQIWAESSTDLGSTFYFTLPKNFYYIPYS